MDCLLTIYTSLAIAVTATGIMITEIGYFAPFIVIGSTIATVGLSMIYTLSVDSGIGMWLSYQVIVGLGIGLCFQPPIMACQALAAPEDVSATTAVLLCKQIFFPLCNFREIMWLPFQRHLCTNDHSAS